MKLPKGSVLAIVSALLFAFNIVVNKIGLLQPISPFEFTVLSGVVAGLLSLPLIIRKKTELENQSGVTWVQIFTIGITASGLASFLFILGQSLTQAAQAAFLMSSASFFTVIFAFFILGEKLKKQQYMWALILFSGIYLLTVGLHSFQLNFGDFFVILAAIIIGFTNVLAKIPMKKLSGENIAYLRLLIGMFVLLAIVPFVSPNILQNIRLVQPWYILSGILMWGVIVAFYKAIEYAGPALATLVLVSYPFLAALLAAAILEETLTIIQLVGGAIISLSVYKISRS